MSKSKHKQITKQVARCKRKRKRYISKAHRAKLRSADINEENNEKRFAHERFV